MITIILILTILVAGLPFNKNTVSAQWLTRLSSIVIIFSSFLIMNIFYIDRVYDGLSIFSGFISVNSINQTFQILLLLIGGFIVASIVNFSSLSEAKLTNTIKTSLEEFLLSQKYLSNYTLIILFNLIGASCLMYAGDFVMLYIAVETQSFSLYILSTLKNDSAKSASAGLKYFLIGSLASTLILLGIALFYYATGLTNFESIFIYYSITDWFTLDGFTAGITEPASPYNHSIGIWNFAEMNPYYFVGILALVLIITGIFIKIAAAPFHQWSIDVYSLVPTAITTWLVILPKIALFVLLYQILQLILETGTALLYSSANNSIIDWMLDDLVTEYISDVISNTKNINVNYFTNILNNYYYDQLIMNLKYVYGDATHFFPNYLQIELLNTINSPIVNESSYNFVYVPYLLGENGSENKDFLNTIWNDYSSNIHNSLYYTFNITPIGTLTIKNLLILISVISLIIGAIGGLYQLNIKRLLAFSAVSQIGFILLSLSFTNKLGLESFLFFILQYSLINLNVFLVLIALGYSSRPFITKLNSKNLNSDIEYIAQLKGFFTNNPILAISFIVSLFSLAGIPPLPGFFAKQQVLLSAVSLGFIFISIIAILTSVISAAYYLGLIKNSILKRTEFNSLSGNLKTFFNKSSNLTYFIQPINNYLSFNISNVHSYTISLLTMSTLFILIKLEMCLNLFVFLSYFIYKL